MIIQGIQLIIIPKYFQILDIYDEGAMFFSNMLIDDLDKTFEFKDKKYNAVLPDTRYGQ